MKTEIVTLLTVLATVIGTLGGAFITGYFTRRSTLDAIDREWQVGKAKAAEEKTTILLKIYVSAVKFDFEKSIIDYNPYNGNMSFNYSLYTESIRPLIYDGYHLVDSDVIKYFNKIEKTSAEINFLGGYDDIDQMEVSHFYTKMLEAIKQKIDLHRLDLLG